MESKTVAFIKSERKQGTSAKTGKAYDFIAYSFTDPAGQWFGLKGKDEWLEKIKEGDEISGTVESRDYNGQTYYDFRLADPDQVELLRRVDSHEKRIKVLEDMFVGRTPQTGSQGPTEPSLPSSDEINIEDIPF